MRSKLWGIWKGLCLALMLAAGSAQAASVLFLATGNVPPGKFRTLSEIAQPHGVTIESRYLKDIPEDVDAGLFEGYDAVFIDTYLMDAMRGRLAGALPVAKQPIAWLWDLRPDSLNMSRSLAQRLAVYYSNGGQANYDNFFATVAAWLSGQPTDGIADPVVFPSAGLYHPDAPTPFFTDPLAYLRWKGLTDEQIQNPERRPPVVAIAFHEQYVASLQTRLIDTLIRQVEARGAIPMAYYYPVTNDGAIKGLLGPQGKPLADVVISTRIMLEPNGPRRAFEALGIPVIQAMPYRQGDEAQWRADPQGVSLIDVPFYMSQAEYAGITDIQVASAMSETEQQLVPIDAQLKTVVGKSLRLAALQRMPNADKRLSIFFWNYPAGEKNLSASFLNVPESLVNTLGALKDAGYDTTVPAEDALLSELQRLLEPYYREGRLEALLADGLADRMPLTDYLAWFNTLPESVRNALDAQWGAPESSGMVLRENGEAFFVVPRLLLGKVAILPQPPRGEQAEDKEKAIYHSPNALPSHFYLASYLWARTRQASDAFVHFGTHGSQEWLPGKERGLSVTEDYPMLMLGDVPVVYPYIADNIGEALNTRRRGRAVVISHQTPPFRPAGMHDELMAIHELLLQWKNQDQGAVREKIRAELVERVTQAHIEQDMGWTQARVEQDFLAFLEALHEHLDELAQTAQPLGLHALGRAPQEEHRLYTVLMMLGQSFWEASAAQAGGADAEQDEVFAVDYEKMTESAPYVMLRSALIEGRMPEGASPELLAQLEKGRAWYEAIGAQGELPGLLDALAGRYVPTSYGGDPIKNPDAYPTGRNLYGFDPSRVPTPQAWEAGKEAAENLIAAHRKKTGAAPKKITFSLWSVETMRHKGLLEAQALWLMGVEPVWDKGGRVVDVRLVPRETLGRPRVDVVLSGTGLYRDHFPNAMKQLARAVQLAAQAEGESDNAVAANTNRIQAQLQADGVPEATARAAAETRMFSSASGAYSTGLDGAAMATDTWEGKEEGDRKMADLYLSKMQYAYGPDSSTWGQAGVTGAAGVNLYAEQLRGTEGAVLSRSSNTYGMLTTDDPFQYLGGIGLAVRRLDGAPPQLYISNLRGGGAGRVENAAEFLSKELATRQFHPGYIKGLMAEGYSGTLQVLNATNNLWGWTAVAREVVRDDQWEQMADVYVRDKYDLGLKEWFEKENPHALAQTIERMIEAARQGYWQAEPETVELLKERYRDLAARFDVRSDNARFLEYVADGQVTDTAFAATPATPAQPEALPAEQPASEAPTEQVEGMKLERTPETSEPVADQTLDLARLALIVLLLAALGVGAIRQARRSPGRMPHSA
ncbi:MAG: cobaltochelatase subunit CobN [Castellaniella sp.]|uniref:cobaltochelatase subunit CobN n=1 Tax=Castellaniella sp. TaxID=1955812 RepID=UPI003A8603B4